ncbi:MAG: beta-lactamase family protein [Lachnospiraceae bacterium]|nr:beta-lactamase family protein [Lachnospiraceae bacterium]
MKRARKYLAFLMMLGVILTQGAIAQAAVETLPSGTAYEGIGEEIEAFVAEHEATNVGMAVSIFGQGETIYTNYFGYADKEAKLAVTQETVMEWGSATKLLVWVSVMQLWEQGKLDLEADVRTYLSEDMLTNLNYDTPVTMTHLMNHQAGFQEHYSDLFVKEQENILSLEEALKAHRPEQIYEPGTVTAYSNWGCALAGYIVERVSGMSFAEYVHKNIFEPLGMGHSALAADLSDNLWVQEQRKELQCYTIEGTLIPDCFYYITLYPAGMCTSTLEDFESFGKALLREDSPLFDSTDTWKMLFTASAYLGDSEIPSNYHGFWVLPYGVETVGHGGNTAGCSSYLWLDLQNRIGAVVMTNQSNETIYNGEMMELVFGNFSAQEYFAENRKEWEGIYRPGRTVRKGPFKLMSLSFMLGEVEEDDYWMTGTFGGVEKVCYPYGDWVRVPVWQFVLELTLVLMWIVALVFSMVSLLVKLIRKLVNVCRRKRSVVVLGRWSALAAVVQLANLLLLVWVAYQALSYAMASTYMWAFAVFAVLAGAMVGMTVYGVQNVLRKSSARIRKLYNWVTIVLLISTVANILYWNLFMGWLV